MASKFRLRRLFKPIIMILAKGFSNIGLTPNCATLIMFFSSLISFFTLFFFKNYFWFGITVFITGIFDGIDGAIARLKNLNTRFGGFFDSVMDRMSEFIIFFSLLINRWDQTLFFFIDMKLVILLILFVSIMISYSRSRADTFHTGDYDIGLMARSERLFAIFLISLISSIIGFLNEMLIFFLLLVFLTATYRAIKIHAILKNLNK